MKTRALFRSVLVMLCVLAASGCVTHQSTNDPSGAEIPRAETARTQTSNAALEQAVADAVLCHNRGRFLGGDKQMFSTVYYEIRKTVEQNESTEVYLIALYAQYEFDGGEARLTGGGCSPCAITFESVGGVYSPAEYWEPEDGENFESSVRGKFPEDALEDGMDLSEPNAMEICNQRAVDYFARRGA